MVWDLIGFVAFGLVVGVVARILKSGKQDLGIGATIVLGMAGSLVGGLVASLLGTGNVWELDWLGAIVAFVAAFALVGAAESLFGKSKRKQLG